MATIEEAFEQFKQLPDWDKYPMPEVFYEHFKVKKPQPAASLMESLTYQAPPSMPLNKDGKVEIRQPAEGGVREVEVPLPLPVEQTFITDENDSCSRSSFDGKRLMPPIEDAMKESQPSLDPPSPNPSYAADGTSPDVPYRGVVYSRVLKNLQNESS